MQPLDAIHQDLARGGVVDMCTVLVTQAVATDLLAVQMFLDSLGCRMPAATE